MPVFKQKTSVLYAAMNSIHQVLDRLERIGIILKEDSEWDAPTVYIKRKNKHICICADFLIGLNECLKYYEYPSAEDIFANRNGGKIFSKVDLSDAYLLVI